MSTRWEKTAAGAVAIACAVMLQPAAAQPTPLHIRVAVQDYAGISPAVINQAETVATRIYRQIGVEITWLHAAGFDQMMPDNQAADAVSFRYLTHVLLLSPEMENQIRTGRGTLGIAVAGSHVVHVFVHRVEFAARDSQAPVADVLGHVIAHETGHLLLGPNAHSTTGLMAEGLDLPRIANGGLWFDRVQAAIIRGKLVGG